MTKTQSKTDQNKPRRLGRGLSSLISVDTPVRVEVPPSAGPNGAGKPAALAPAPAATPTPAAVPAPAPAAPTAAPTTQKNAGSGGGVQGSTLSDLQSIPVSAIEPSPFQPRRVFDDAAIERLAESIRNAGVMQPVVVRALKPGRYELVVGERRWRAARAAGLTHIPAIVRALEDEQAAEWALIENVQREDLNPMERAWALRSIAEKFDLTQADLADRVAMERPTVANLIRLTDLEKEIAELISNGSLSPGHGKALLSMPAGAARVQMARDAAAGSWTVRRLEHAAKAAGQAGKPAPAKPAANEARFAVLRDLERQISQHLGTKVAINADRKGRKGKLVIEFYGIDHFDGLLERLGMSNV